ncbi:MAG: hypothetical protein V3V15_07365 [Sphingorhabdus sp.]
MINAPKKRRSFRTFLKRLKNDNSGLALVEFAISLPFFMGLTIGGFEVASYSLTHMRLNQLTINTADSAARMGEGNPLQAKRITELMINDVFAGTIREGESVLLGGDHPFVDPSTGEIVLRGNARIIVSSVEPVAAFDPDDPRYRIRWQRCIGQASRYTSNFGDPDTATSEVAIGPAGRQVAPPEGGAIMFVELQYFYRPAILNGFTRLTDRTITQTAAMVVRDDRDYTQIFNPESVNISDCDDAPITPPTS